MADDLQKEAVERLRECRKQKSAPWMLDFKEGYFFAAPHRQRMMQATNVAPASAPVADAAELNTSEAFILCADFVTEIVNTYMPEAQVWCERGPGMFIPPKLFEEVKDKVKAADEQIHAAMKASNLYSEIPKAFNPDLALGTVGLWIDQRRPYEPISVLAVPLRQIECCLGPDGRVDTRFNCEPTTNRYVKSKLPAGAWDKVEQRTRDEIEKNPERPTEIRHGFWRKWDESDVCWQHVILIKEVMVHDAELRGNGCIPFLIGRFNPSADWVWGLGPLIMGLPEIRQVDELERQEIENIALALSPPFTYPNDSFAAIEQGIEPGSGYPIQPGTEGAVKPIYQAPPPDKANYATQAKIHILRKLFYIDYPEQSGDTPPTLGQWLDELARAQRRIGTPGMPFWREVPAEIFGRFDYLMTAAGAIEKIVADGRIVATLPLNPAQRAAEQQLIASATQFAQIMSQMFPEEWKMVVDGRATMMAFMEKMRVAGLIKVRDEAQVAAFVKQIAPLVAGGAAPGPGMPQGAGAPGPQPATTP